MREFFLAFLVASASAADLTHVPEEAKDQRSALAIQVDQETEEALQQDKQTQGTSVPVKFPNLKGADIGQHMIQRKDALTTNLITSLKADYGYSDISGPGPDVSADNNWKPSLFCNEAVLEKYRLLNRKFDIAARLQPSRPSDSEAFYREREVIKAQLKQQGHDEMGQLMKNDSCFIYLWRLSHQKGKGSRVDEVRFLPVNEKYVGFDNDGYIKFNIPADVEKIAVNPFEVKK